MLGFVFLKAKEQDESFAIFDMGMVVERYAVWRRCFPDIQPFFGKNHISTLANC